MGDSIPITVQRQSPNGNLKNQHLKGADNQMFNSNVNAINVHQPYSHIINFGILMACKEHSTVPALTKDAIEACAYILNLHVFFLYSSISLY